MNEDNPRAFLWPDPVDGPGAEERRAVAVVVIGGQTLCLLLTLVVTPVVYSLLDDLARTAKSSVRLALENRSMNAPPAPVVK